MKSALKKTCLIVVAAVTTSSLTSIANAQRCAALPVTIYAQPGIATVGTSGPDVILGTNGKGAFPYFRSMM